MREMESHIRSGLAVCACVMFRLICGAIGSNTARFAGFLGGPRDVTTYLRAAEPWRGTAHNPLGRWNVVLLLAALTVQVATGVFAVDVDGIESGPLSYFVSFNQGRAATGIYEVSFNFLRVLSAIHIVAIAVYFFIKRRNLVTAMVTGSTSDVRADPARALVVAPLWRLVTAIMITGLLTYAISRGFQF